MAKPGAMGPGGRALCGRCRRPARRHGFKISAVPFHFWCPDVRRREHRRDDALSVASKAPAALLRVLTLLAAGLNSGPLHDRSPAVGVMGGPSPAPSATPRAGSEQHQRLLAYSSIAHAGYMLKALSPARSGTTTSGRAVRFGAHLRAGTALPALPGGVHVHGEPPGVHVAR
jgi:NADH:ubiquinone oxidoreductase subunit 2 (subunit N)